MAAILSRGLRDNRKNLRVPVFQLEWQSGRFDLVRIIKFTNFWGGKWAYAMVGIQQFLPPRRLSQPRKGNLQLSQK